MFSSTDDAMEKLVDVILLQNQNKSFENVVLVVIGLEGVESAQIIAKKLKIPMEFLFTEIIYAPLNEECPVAVVSEDMEIVANEALINSFGISLDYIYGEAQRKYEEEISQKRYLYRKGELLTSLANKEVIIMDLGIETGLRINVALKTCINTGAKSVYVASPIMPKSIYDSLSEICDSVYCVSALPHFVSVEHYFPELTIPSEQTIANILNTYKIKT